MKTLALMAVVPVLLTQAANPSARDLLGVARPLTNSEIDTVLSASRRALAAKTFRLASIHGNQEREVLMGRAGRPKIIRSVLEGGIIGGVVFADGTTSGSVETHRKIINMTHYTGLPARDCGGSAEQGELVVEYKHESSTNRWTATARRRDAHDFGGPGISPIFEMLQGAGPITSAERRLIRGRWARALTSPWAPPAPGFAEPPLLIGDPIPNVAGELRPDDAIQLLWVDTESLLPVRWEASNRGSFAYGYDFRYRASDLRPPAGIESPPCIR
jgi:hypothetical protein